MINMVRKGYGAKYGFLDAFNPTVKWYDKDYLGLDQGPIVIMIENYMNGFVWKYFYERSNCTERIDTARIQK